MISRDSSGVIFLEEHVGCIGNDKVTGLTQGLRIGHGPVKEKQIIAWTIAFLVLTVVLIPRCS